MNKTITLIPLMFIGCNTKTLTENTPIEVNTNKSFSQEILTLTPTVIYPDPHHPRSDWYRGRIYYIDQGIANATFQNLTNKTQLIGFAIYKVKPDGSKIGYYREYFDTPPDELDPVHHVYNIPAFVPVGCHWEGYLAQMNAPFDPFVPNVNKNGYLIAFEEFNVDNNCE